MISSLRLSHSCRIDTSQARLDLWAPSAAGREEGLFGEHFNAALAYQDKLAGRIPFGGRLLQFQQRAGIAAQLGTLAPVCIGADMVDKGVAGDLVEWRFSSAGRKDRIILQGLATAALGPAGVAQPRVG